MSGLIEELERRNAAMQVACSFRRCGEWLPRCEAVIAEGFRYCCEAHARMDGREPARRYAHEGRDGGPGSAQGAR